MSAEPGSRVRRADTVLGRTVLVAIAAAAISACVALIVSVPLIRSAAVRQAHDALSDLADVAAATVVNPQPGSLARLRTELQSRNTEASLVLPGAPLPAGVPPDLLSPLLEGRPVSGTFTADGQDWLIEGRPVGGGGIVLVAPADISNEAVDRGLRRLFIALTVGLAAAIGVAVVVSRKVTAPLRRVAEGAEELAAGGRDVRVEPEGPLEVVEIADAINRLARALAVSEGRQREFLLSVSHELRTPLTAVAGYAEALADGVVAGDEVPRTGTVMLGESRRLERLVADLLDLSRLGAADLRIDHHNTDLAELVRQAGAVWADRCQREGVRLELEVPSGPLPATTDPDRLRQIIDNLAENALRVTPVGGVIVLALQPGTAGLVVLQVRDSGPGLSPQDQLDAFEPGVLYSRYRGVRPVSSGVGLALVGRLAARLGGGATAGNAPEGGAAFSVTLPRVGPGDPQRGPERTADRAS